MTFKVENNGKGSTCDKNSNAQNVTTECGTARISTIYDPRQGCSPVPSFTVSILSGPYLDIDKKKTLMEKIKKITFNLKLKKCNDEDSNRRQIKLLCCAILLTCTTLIKLTALIYFFNSSQKPEIRNIIVDGEFQILNKEFEYEMLDKQSTEFQEFSMNLTNELNRLFKRSEVHDYFQYSDILEITPNMTVKCITIFHSSDYVNVGKIGLAFLRSLRLQHGHTYLGTHTINVQSIGFQIRGEEGLWGEWSDWKGCDSSTEYVATRTRKCLTKDMFQVTNVDRCLLIPGNKSDLDIIPCKKYYSIIKQKEIENLTKNISSKETDENILPNVSEMFPDIVSSEFA